MGRGCECPRVHTHWPSHSDTRWLSSCGLRIPGGDIWQRCNSNLNPSLLRMWIRLNQGREGPAFNRRPQALLPCLVWQGSGRARPGCRPPPEEHWGGGPVPSHLPPSFRPVVPLTHIPHFPGLQPPWRAADRADSWSRHVNGPQPRQVWL